MEWGMLGAIKKRDILIQATGKWEKDGERCFGRLIDDHLHVEAMDHWKKMETMSVHLVTHRRRKDYQLQFIDKAFNCTTNAYLYLSQLLAIPIEVGFWSLKHEAC